MNTATSVAGILSPAAPAGIETGKAMMVGVVFFALGLAMLCAWEAAFID